MTLIELARKLRPHIEHAVEGFGDKEASECVPLFRRLTKSGTLVEAQTRINWKGALKRSKVALWDIESQDPDHAPELWDDIEYRDGARVIHETIVATKAFAMNELGWWEGKVYRSKRDGNTFPPSVTPEWWEEV